MLEIKDIIELETNDNTKRLSFATRYLVQVHFTFDLSVVSDKFRGTSHFCVYKGYLESLCSDLLKIYTSSLVLTRLSDNDSDGFVEFTIQNNGQLIVSGQIGGSHEDNFVTFNFNTDQTLILQFISDFQNLLKYKNE